MTGKARPKPWLCRFISTACQSEAEVHCPACDRILCKQCFTVHKLRGCPAYTGTDQCLCIWEQGAEYCEHDMRGLKGYEGTPGVEESGAHSHGNGEGQFPGEAVVTRVELIEWMDSVAPLWAGENFTGQTFIDRWWWDLFDALHGECLEHTPMMTFRRSKGKRS